MHMIKWYTLRASSGRYYVLSQESGFFAYDQWFLLSGTHKYPVLGLEAVNGSLDKIENERVNIDSFSGVKIVYSNTEKGKPLGTTARILDVKPVADPSKHEENVSEKTQYHLQYDPA
jgi:hypothetical protein